MFHVWFWCNETEKKWVNVVRTLNILKTKYTIASTNLVHKFQGSGKEVVEDDAMTTRKDSTKLRRKYVYVFLVFGIGSARCSLEENKTLWENATDESAARQHRVTDVVCLSLCVNARAKTMIPEAKCNLDRCVCYGGVSGSGYGRLMEWDLLLVPCVSVFAILFRTS